MTIIEVFLLKIACISLLWVADNFGQYRQGELKLLNELNK